MRASSRPQGACMKSPNVSGLRVGELRCISTAYLRFFSLHDFGIVSAPRRHTSDATSTTALTAQHHGHQHTKPMPPAPRASSRKA